MRQREAEIKLLKEREKALACNLATVTKEFAGVKVENASFRWFHGDVDDKIEALCRKLNPTLVFFIKISSPLQMVYSEKFKINANLRLQFYPAS